MKTNACTIGLVAARCKRRGQRMGRILVGLPLLGSCTYQAGIQTQPGMR
jgi:hypothetical protein